MCHGLTKTHSFCWFLTKVHLVTRWSLSMILWSVEIIAPDFSTIVQTMGNGVALLQSKVGFSVQKLHRYPDLEQFEVRPAIHSCVSFYILSVEPQAMDWHDEPGLCANLKRQRSLHHLHLLWKSWWRWLEGCLMKNRTLLLVSSKGSVVVSLGGNTCVCFVMLRSLLEETVQVLALKCF